MLIPKSSRNLCELAQVIFCFIGFDIGYVSDLTAFVFFLDFIMTIIVNGACSGSRCSATDSYHKDEQASLIDVSPIQVVLDNLHSPQFSPTMVVSYFNALRGQFGEKLLFSRLEKVFLGNSPLGYRVNIFRHVWGTECQWLADWLVKYALSSFYSYPQEENSRNFFLFVLDFLCDVVIQENLSSHSTTSEDSDTRLLARLILATDVPERAVTHIINSHDAAKCAHIVLHDLCECLFDEIAVSMRRSACEEEKREDVHKLITVLQWILLHSPNKPDLIRKIARAIAIDGDCFFAFRDDFAKLMTKSEETQFRADLEQSKKDLMVRSQPALCLVREYDNQAPGFYSSSSDSDSSDDSDM